MIDNVVQRVKINTVKKLVQPGCTLDIGCGDRTYTRHMPNPVGIEVNKIYEGKESVPDYWMDARELNFPNAFFYNVCLLDTLEHIPEVDIVIKNAYRVLKKNGCLIIVDPNDSVLFWSRLFTGRIKEALKGNPDHVHRFNKSKLIELTQPFFALEKTIHRGIFTGYRFRRVEDEN